MGLMKAFLMDKIHELSVKIGCDERLIYNDKPLYEMACRYADFEMLKLVDNESK